LFSEKELIEIELLQAIPKNKHISFGKQINYNIDYQLASSKTSTFSMYHNPVIIFLHLSSVITINPHQK